MGDALLTQGVHFLDPDVKMSILAKVKAFDKFTEANDPYGEHDFGAIEMMGAGKVFWKIDYYDDSNMEFGAEDKDNCISRANNHVGGRLLKGELYYGKQKLHRAIA